MRGDVSEPRFPHGPEIAGIFVEAMLILIILFTFGIIRC